MRPLNNAPSRDLNRIRKAHRNLAILTAEDPIYAPVFERLERMLAQAEAANTDDPIARARAAVAQMATL
jgi:hypothetical protein